MNKRLVKYFWDLNENAVGETGKIIKDSQHPKFAMRMVTLLSRCQQPDELFSLIPKNEFIKGWPKIKSYWLKVAKSSDFRDWWQTIYEQIISRERENQNIPKAKVSEISLRIGRMIKDERIKRGLSQRDFALKLGMKQPDISNVEKGKKNITLETLVFLCKALQIRKLELW